MSVDKTFKKTVLLFGGLSQQVKNSTQPSKHRSIIANHFFIFRCCKLYAFVPLKFSHLFFRFPYFLFFFFRNLKTYQLVSVWCLLRKNKLKLREENKTQEEEWNIRIELNKKKFLHKKFSCKTYVFFIYRLCKRVFIIFLKKNNKKEEKNTKIINVKSNNET